MWLYTASKKYQKKKKSWKLKYDCTYCAKKSISKLAEKEKDRNKVDNLGKSRESSRT